MNNKNDISCLFARKPLPLLCALIVGGLFGTSQAQAGGFMVPTTNTAGWGRAMAGGSLFPNDPSAAFNNPAAMAFIDKRIAQLTVNYADIDIKYNGEASSAGSQSGRLLGPSMARACWLNWRRRCWVSPSVVG